MLDKAIKLGGDNVNLLALDDPRLMGGVSNYFLVLLKITHFGNAFCSWTT
jgi:hypothetical protein